MGDDRAMRTAEVERKARIPALVWVSEFYKRETALLKSKR